MSKLIVKMTPGYPSRRIPRLGAVARKRHATRTGQVLITWNNLQTAFQFLFCVLLIGEKGDVSLGKEIWMTLQADSSQRDILSPAVRVKLRENKPARERAAWAIKVANALSQHRNDFTHVPVNFKGDEVAPSWFGASKARVQRMSMADIGKIQRVLTGDLLLLSAFVGSISMHLLKSPMQPALPKIPRLQIHTVFPDLKPKLRFLPTPRVRGGRPQASGA